MKLRTQIPQHGDHVVAPRETDLKYIVSIGKEEARRRERKICNSSNNDHDDDLGGNNSNSSEAFFVVDVECIKRKYHCWGNCFPRIKPFYGKCCPYAFFRLHMYHFSGEEKGRESVTGLGVLLLTGFVCKGNIYHWMGARANREYTLQLLRSTLIPLW